MVEYPRIGPKRTKVAGGTLLEGVPPTSHGCLLVQFPAQLCKNLVAIEATCLILQRVRKPKWKPRFDFLQRLCVRHVSTGSFNLAPEKPVKVGSMIMCHSASAWKSKIRSENLVETEGCMRNLSALLFFVCCLCRASSIGSNADAFEVFASSTSGPCNTGFLTVSGATCSGTVGVAGTTAQFSYDSYGLASYGSLGAYAEGSTTAGVATSGPIPSLVGTAALGYFTDTFTINATDTCGGSPCPATGPGTVEFQFLVTGSGTGPFGYCMDVLPGTDPTTLNCTVAADASFPVAGSPIITSQPFAITFGQPITLTIGLLAYGHLTEFSQGFTANFANTSELAGFVVDDSNGNQLTNFSVTSGSGTAYPDTTLPEPSTFLMLGTAVPLIALWRRAHARCVPGSRHQADL
jgi:hypothetical protein